ETLDLTAAPVYDIADIIKDPHVVARSILVDVPDADLGTVRMTAPTPRLADTPASVRWAGPPLGAHNRDVYTSLGLGAGEIAARKYPDRVVAALPLPDPTDDGAAARLDAALTKSPARAIGEVHLRQMGRRNIDRDPGDPAFGRILEVAAARGVPVVVHYELTDAAAAALDRALAAHRKATLVLAHAGEGPPAR